jgi:acyl-CoA synthetase (AMP-forming)/AMP-acid ligase II/aryl carrier-like protein
MDATTLSALLEARRDNAPRLSYLEGERAVRSISGAELYERALGILYRLQRLGARPGDPMLLLLSGNEPFVDAFWAAVLGGIIPVPIAPGVSDEHRHKALRVARRFKAPFIYTEARLLERLRECALEHREEATFEALRARAFLVDELDALGRSGKAHRAAPADTAFIQFSSGSTAEPKGVVLTHANLMANIHALAAGAGLQPHDRSLSWMPLTHDMGLIGFCLTMFGAGVHTHLMPTELFVRRPLLWLQLASQVGATLLCSPNFGYRHYLKVLGERAVPELNLRPVRLIFNGAEPISVQLCEEFLARLAPTGLAHDAMFPVYGLAEASLGVTFPPLRTAPHTIYLDRRQLGVGARPQPLAADARDALALMGVGRVLPCCELRIAGDLDEPLPASTVGHIQIRGASVTGGYYDDPAANALAFTADGWLRTGDLGLLREGELYVTGRQKEIVFVNGQNYYPYDLEHLAEGVAGLELGKVVVAGVRPAHAQTDELVVFVLFRGPLPEFVPLARALRHRLAERSGLEVQRVVPVHRIPKTTSGKIQRHLLEQELQDGAFDAALAELAALESARPEAAVAGGQVEQQLRGICESELDGRTIELDESLFDLGASSLKLLAIHERIERLWPGKVEVTDLFEHPTIGELAQFIETRQVEARQDGAA